MPDDLTDEPDPQAAPRARRPAPAPVARRPAPAPVPRRRTAVTDAELPSPAQDVPSPAEAESAPEEQSTPRKVLAKKVAVKAAAKRSLRADDATQALELPTPVAPTEDTPVEAVTSLVVADRPTNPRTPTPRKAAALPSPSDRSEAVAERATEPATGDPGREVPPQEPVVRRDTAFAPAAAVVDTGRPPRTGALIALIVLLLALAAGLGAAAIVKDRTPVWEAHSTVHLQPGPASSVTAAAALADGQRRYVEKVRNAGFTGLAALKAGMPDSEISKTDVATAGDDGALVLTVSATTRKGAIALANASALTLVETVASDQKLLTPGDRLGVRPDGPARSATRTTPTNGSIALAGLLAGAAVLLIAGLLLALRRSKKS